MLICFDALLVGMMRSAVLAICGMLLVTGLGTLVSAKITCIQRPGGANLVCVTFNTYPGGICVVESTDPPAPLTWQSSTTCQAYPVLS